MTIAEKLEVIDARFRKGSKQYKSARFIVRLNRSITSDEKLTICKEIPMSYKSLEGLFTKLRKMGLYPPQETLESPYQSRALFRSDGLIMTDIWDKKPKGNTYILEENQDEWLADLKAYYDNRLADLKTDNDNRLADLKADNDNLKIDFEIVKKIKNYKDHKKHIKNYPTDGPFIIVYESAWVEHLGKSNMYDKLDYEWRFNSWEMPKEELTIIPRKNIAELKEMISELSGNKNRLGHIRRIISHAGTRQASISKPFLRDLREAAGMPAED